MQWLGSFAHVCSWIFPWQSSSDHASTSPHESYLIPTCRLGCRKSRYTRSIVITKLSYVRNSREEITQTYMENHALGNRDVFFFYMQAVSESSATRSANARTEAHPQITYAVTLLWNSIPRDISSVLRFRARATKPRLSFSFPLQSPAL